MRRFALRCGLLALTMLLGSCTRYGVFEDVGSDPHPPWIRVLGVAYTPVAPPLEPTAPEAPPPEPGTEPETPAPAPTEPPLPPPVFLPADGFEIVLNDPERKSIIIRVLYADDGGDIVTFQLRDRDSAFRAQAVPAAPEVDLNGDGLPDTLDAPGFFSGTSGMADLEGIYEASMLGPHRIEMWAEDGHGSRSPKVTFTLNVVLAKR